MKSNMIYSSLHVSHSILMFSYLVASSNISGPRRCRAEPVRNIQYVASYNSLLYDSDSGLQTTHSGFVFSSHSLS